MGIIMNGEAWGQEGALSSGFEQGLIASVIVLFNS